MERWTFMGLVRRKLEADHLAREQTLRLSRTIIQLCANAIRATHRQEFDQAQRLLGQAREAVSQMHQAVMGQAETLCGGIIHDAEKEYAEAWATLHLVLGRELPNPDSLQVGYAAYLNGLGEAAGELRRYILDTLRRGEVGRSEELLDIIDDIYTLLVTIDLPDAVTGGLRRTTDMVRGVLERTRGDLTLARQQQGLNQQINALSRRLDDWHE